MLDDLRRSISAILYERAVSPLYGTFIFSWLVSNWKIVIAIFYGGEWETLQSKVAYISQHLNWWNGLLIPVGLTPIIIYGGTLLSNAVYKWHARMLHARVEAKKEIEKSKRLTVEQSAEIMGKYEQQKEYYGNLVNDYDGKLKQKESTIEDLNQNLQDMDKKLLGEKAITKQYREDIEQREGHFAFEEKKLSDEIKRLSAEKEALQQENEKLKRGEYDSKGFTDEEVAEIVERIFRDDYLLKGINAIITFLCQGRRENKLSDHILNYLLSNELVEDTFEGYQITSKGKALAKKLMHDPRMEGDSDEIPF